MDATARTAQMSVSGATTIGIGILLLAIGIVERQHERVRVRDRSAEIMPGMYDGPKLEHEGGRRWLIMRTGGRWL